MQDIDSYPELKSQILNEIAAATAFLNAAQAMSKALENANDVAALAEQSALTMSCATAMQELHEKRDGIFEKHGFTLPADASKLDPELQELESQRRSCVEQAQQLNTQNGVVVSSLLGQAQEKMLALQRAARQGDTYSATGQDQSPGSRALACV